VILQSIDWDCCLEIEALTDLSRLVQFLSEHKKSRKSAGALVLRAVDDGGVVLIKEPDCDLFYLHFHRAGPFAVIKLSPTRVDALIAAAARPLRMLFSHAWIRSPSSFDLPLRWRDVPLYRGWTLLGHIAMFDVGESRRTAFGLSSGQSTQTRIMETSY
jgi:hypothetical protein